MNKRATTAIPAIDLPARSTTGYPDPFRQAVAGRGKRALGDHFGLRHYGVNLVELQPGAWSSQRHWHTHEDEFVYVVAGELVLVNDQGEQTLTAGMIMGFPASVEDGHHLVNRGEQTATYLEIGDRHHCDEVFYPDIDMELRQSAHGSREFRRRDGTPYSGAG